MHAASARTTTLALLLVVTLLLSGDVFADDSLAIFEKRILPIMNSPKPSSCSECHLAGVELGDYIRPTQSETFASLVDAGLIDTESPEESKLLEFIRRAPEKSSPIKKEIRQQELQAFTAWIKAAAGDPKLLSANDEAKPIGPRVSGEVIRHGREDRVLASFEDNVWSESLRCAGCHSPQHNARQVERWGEQMSWIVPGDPQGTLDYMIDADLIDVHDPAASLLLTKPTLQVKHGGGKKTSVGDRTYKQFRTFIEDYAATVTGQYEDAEDLPPENEEVARVSKIFLRLTGVPAKYDKKLLQADVYHWTDAGWSKQRVATTDHAIFGKRNVWGNSLSLTATRGTRRARHIDESTPDQRSLPPGRYLVKLYLDSEDKSAADHTYQLGEDEFVGQITLNTRWPIGFKNATVAKFPLAP